MTSTGAEGGGFEVLIVRTIAAVSGFAAVVVADAADPGRTSSWLLLAGASAAVLSAAMPDSAAGLLLVAIVAGTWLVQVDGAVTPWAVAGGGLVAVFHCTTAFAAGLPWGAALDPVMTRRWAGRLGVVLGTTAVVGTLLMAAGPNERQAPVLVDLAIALALAGSVVLRRRSLPGS